MNENQAWIQEIRTKLDEKLSRLAKNPYDAIPYTTVNGKHVPKESKSSVAWWTNGFWPGLMWLMYSETKKEEYLLAARRGQDLLDKAWSLPQKIHHDVGFMWRISTGVDHALTGDEDAWKNTIKAADYLLTRYNEKGDYIVAWNKEEQKGYSIIDTMMNLSLLYWATEQTGDPKYAEIAKKHADMSLRHHLRPDGSVVHIVNHKTDCLEILETLGGQGYGVGSSWSRGASWAVYGFAISYRHTGEERYLNAAKQAAHYFISQASLTNWLPLIDFRAPETPVVYDSTAGAITACGLIEIARHVPELEKRFYLDAAMKLLKSLEKAFCNWSEDEDGVLLGGSERYGKGENMHIIYGDYFFTEAILKLGGNEFHPW